MSIEKSWLIRTKSNHLLGPVSKDKVIELYNNGSIKQDDEICSGNGYWFFVREDELVTRFLLGNEIQTFNPISEAKDVLIAPINKPRYEPTRDDITLIGNLNLNQFKDSSKPVAVSTLQEVDKIEVKKKIKPEAASKKSSIHKSQKVFKKQGYLPYLGILGFLILFVALYFRNTIIKSFFSDVQFPSFNLITVAHGQEAVEKNLLEQEIVFDDVKFWPQVGIEGFRVISSFDITKISCDKFSNEVHQMAIILYPTDSFNENFLIKVRDCVVKLKEGHPLKQWLNWIAKPVTSSVSNPEERRFLTEVINTPFNLITDLKMKEKIVLTISQIPNNTLPEKIFRSYLFLMIGNVAKSDNILREIISRPPFLNWQGYSGAQSEHHKLAKNNLRKLLQKIFKHPADRRSVELLGLYFTSFFNDPHLIEIIKDLKSGSLDGTELGLRYVERISPAFVHYLRFARASDKRRIKNLRDLERFPLAEQAYWDWAFLDIDPLIADHMLNELNTIEKQDKLWFIYLMDNEKLSDWYIAKMHRSFLTGKRQFLRNQLQEKSLFMLSLFKLIQSGDIDTELIQKATTLLTHD